MNQSQEKATLRANHLKIEPFQFLDFLQWESLQTFNEHGYLRMTGLIAEENRTVYEEMATKETWVCAKTWDEAGSEFVLFQGVLTQLSIQSQHQFHTMTIEIKTGTFLLDQVSHTRTFQLDSTAYESVIETCLSSVKGDFIMREKRAEKIGQFTVQYRESDWAFIKRLAKRLGVVIFPETRTRGKRFLVGLNPNEKAEEISVDTYILSRSLHDPHSLINEKLGTYQIQTRDVYELGQAVQFQGKRLIVCQIESRLEQSELIHYYTLGSIQSTYEMKPAHDAIKGVAMKASITQVSKDRVQISIHEDENRSQSGARWFDYATVYSTPDGTGWYAMPELGDEVRVLFPDTDESGAYVSSSVHLETKGGRTNPAHKSWKNKQRKEILFTPDTLTLTNNNGLSIELSDQRGITIHSNRGIFLQSDGQIQLDSQKAGITVSGERNLTLQQGAAQIHMQDAIDISGGKINMN